MKNLEGVSEEAKSLKLGSFDYNDYTYEFLGLAKHSENLEYFVRYKLSKYDEVELLSPASYFPQSLVDMKIEISDLAKSFKPGRYNHYKKNSYQALGVGI